MEIAETQTVANMVVMYENLKRRNSKIFSQQKLQYLNLYKREKNVLSDS